MNKIGFTVQDKNPYAFEAHESISNQRQSSLAHDSNLDQEDDQEDRGHNIDANISIIDQVR